ncbi:conserved hypothetical protein [Planktothrix tepida PCC 9214]|uniref:Uncharacterized protein n=1 Tax=Planktothrix tepida PCC 9214 TaxID=671072 RepID=A0A1J1LQS6_9CYAN|nr:conserved hypothetical protein [Planktothrix tepida PCC 9214]
MELPLLRSYTIMSEPSLLEYQVLSSALLMVHSPSVFGISTEVWVCPTLPVLRQSS